MFYLNIFFIFAISGYILETITFFVINKPYNSSILYGPWTPIYGIASLIMVVVYLIIHVSLRHNNLYTILITEE